MSVTVTLRQEKTVLADSYCVTSWITNADPSGMYPLFVVQPGPVPEQEEWERVATLDDLAQYVENPLVRIEAATPGQFTAIGAIPSDHLIITNAPAAWFTTVFIQAVFRVASVDPSGNYLLVTPSGPFPRAESGLAWTLKDEFEVTTRGSGTNGKCYRQTTGSTDPFLRRHWTEEFATVQKALDRVTSNNTYVESLVTQANTYGATFAGVDTETYPQ